MPDPETGDFPTNAPEPAFAVGGDMIGPYKLRQRLGEGGMGEVWAADQSEPVHRQVAVKLIRTGMDSAAMISRFNIERQALALMDHPNIAKVLDAGATTQGRPYFVMELVKGIPITRYCDNERLTPRERLELFIPVCQAVQHAHQKGIIHRDLKPSNILVGLYDGRPAPKVIDFGVAKATGTRLTDESLHTDVGAIVGTLEYMAPEQAGVDSLDIDTRADVYSLGVILYELLAGSPPFSRRKLVSGALEEMLRLIRAEEPVKPSTKLSSAEDLPSLAAVRRYEPRRLTNLLRGDLDWITMKCLEKQRARRYDAVSGLVEDLRHYLDDEPVSAGPPSRLYVMRKFVHRHRGPVTAAGLLLLALVAGFMGTAWGMVRADRARQAETLAKDVATANAQRAEANLDAAIQSTTKLAEVTERVLPQLRGSELMRRDLIGATAATAQLMAVQRPNAPEVRRWAAQFLRYDANMNRLLDDTAAAELTYRQAIDLLRGEPDQVDRLAEALRDHAVMLMRVGRLKEALARFQESATLSEQLLTRQPTRSAYRRALATNGVDRSLAESAQGRYDIAAATADRSIGIFRELVAAEGAAANPYDHQLLPAALMAKAVAERERGNYPAAAVKEARELIRTAIERRMFGANSDDAYCVQAMIEYEAARTWLRNQKQDLKKNAQENFDVVVKQFTELVRRHGDIPLYRGWLAKAQLARGEVRLARGQAEEAKTDLDEARNRLEKLVVDHPTIPEYRADLGRCILSLSMLLPADPALRARAITELQAAAAAAPDDVDIKSSLAKAKAP